MRIAYTLPERSLWRHSVAHMPMAEGLCLLCAGILSQIRFSAQGDVQIGVGWVGGLRKKPNGGGQEGGLTGEAFPIYNMLRASHCQ